MILNAVLCNDGLSNIIHFENASIQREREREEEEKKEEEEEEEEEELIGKKAKAHRLSI